MNKNQHSRLRTAATNTKIQLIIENWSIYEYKYLWHYYHDFRFFKHRNDTGGSVFRSHVER